LRISTVCLSLQPCRPAEAVRKKTTGEEREEEGEVEDEEMEGRYKRRIAV